jgi:hypothetical protein
MEWKEHIRHLPGLVEPANIPWIAEILGESTDNLTELNTEAQRDAAKVCSDPKDLQRLMYTVGFGSAGSLLRQMGPTGEEARHSAPDQTDDSSPR